MYINTESGHLLTSVHTDNLGYRRLWLARIPEQRGNGRFYGYRFHGKPIIDNNLPLKIRYSVH